MRYAEVVVNTPIRRVFRPEQGQPDAGDALPDYSALAQTFHYSIPTEMAEHVAVGQLAWVPFGPRQVQAVILALHDSAPVEKTRPLGRLISTRPVLTLPQIELARWMCQHYLAPLLDCVMLMLPSGVAQRTGTVLSLRTRPPFPDDLSSAARKLLERLQHGDVPLQTLKRSAPEVVDDKVLRELRRKGLLRREQDLIDDPVRPRHERQVTLIADPETVARRLPTLGRQSKQADVLEWLAGCDDPLPAVDAVCAACSCTPAVLHALRERGWVEIQPRRTWIACALNENEVRRVLEQELSRAPAQSAALQALAAHKEPVDHSAFQREHGVSANTLRTLAQRGYLRRGADPATVHLTLPATRLRAALMELRGADRFEPVLDLLLRAAGGPVWVGQIYAETNADLNVLRELEAAGLLRLEEEQVWRDPLAGKEFVLDHPPELTPDQARIWEMIETAVHNAAAGEADFNLNGTEDDITAVLPSAPPGFLLHGVTGSGKTEIYLRAIEATLQLDRQAIVLVPEIALTPQTVRRFASRFPDQVGVIHSELSRGERFDTWRRARAGHIQVVVGSRSALFTPFPSLGLIVVDECHDPAYKQPQSPRYHARAAARRLAEFAGAIVLLGSATPDLESYYDAQRGHLQLVELPRRVMGHRQAIEHQQERFQVTETRYRPLSDTLRDARYADLPPVQIVDLRQELRAGNRSILSRALQGELRSVLNAHEQAILFLNRRGTATFVMCRDCGYVQTCKRCDVPMTYHGRGDTLVCHHCSRYEPMSLQCPACGSQRIRYFGAGTQRVEEVVTEMFPKARVVRWDRDTTARKGEHERILQRFISGEANILIGTQMIAKGLDLPLVTLVGVISADTSIYLPDFRAGERTFQILAQVAGRAGRSLRGGRVIVQTYTPDHYAIRAAAAHDYGAFYRQELNFRREQGYPPFRRLARLVLAERNASKAQAEAGRVVGILRAHIERRGLKDVDLLGPAPCFFARQRGHFRWQIVVRASDPAELLCVAPLPLGWRVDIDPVDLL